MDIIRARGELIGGKTIYDMKLKVASYGRVSHLIIKLITLKI